MLKRIFTFILALTLLFSAVHFGSLRANAASIPTLESAECNPGTLKMGAGYGIKGIISAPTAITNVWIKIIDAKNNAIIIEANKKLSGSSKTYDINNLDDKIRFGTLLPGSYRLEITCTVSGSSTVFVVANNPFTVTYAKYTDAVLSKLQDALYNWIAPVRYSYSSPTGGGRYFGANRSSGTRAHAGIDYIPPTKDNETYMVYAMDDGVVLDSYHFYYGTYAIVIKHSNGLIARYGEIENPTLKKGARVKQGDPIAYIKRNNNVNTIMLHLELYYGNGSASGALTNRSNTKYKYTDKSTKFQRRSDLLDPTFLINLPESTPLANSSTSTTPYAPPASTLTISPAKTVYSIEWGNSCSIGGTITSNYPLTEVVGTLDGTQYIKLNSFNGQYSCNIGDSKGLNSFKGADLSAGAHALVITAADSSGATATATITITAKMISKLAVSPKATAYTIVKGNSCSISGTITSNYNLKKVEGILDGSPYITITSFSDKKSCNISDTKGLNSFKGASLSAGTHEILIRATDISNTTVEAKITITVLKSNLKIEPKKTTYSIKKGKSCSIGGTISSDCNLKKVVGTLDGKDYITITSFSSKKKCNIGDTKGLNSFKGASLSVGTHTLKITATDASGNTVTKTIKIVVS